jgi:hypothetical protein
MTVVESELPCPADECRLNYVMDAHHPNARAGQVVLVGLDRADGTVAQGKGRIAAILKRDGPKLESVRLESKRERVNAIPADFSGGYRVTYSQKIADPERGEALIARAHQRTATGKRYPYFVASAIVVARSPDATRPSKVVRRSASLRGTVTEANGFNCTPGPSAFQTPCRSRKAGIVSVKRSLDRPLYVNLISRGFPKLAQARAARFPDLRVLNGGGIQVKRVRVAD